MRTSEKILAMPPSRAEPKKTAALGFQTSFADDTWNLAFEALEKSRSWHRKEQVHTSGNQNPLSIIVLAGEGYEQAFGRWFTDRLYWQLSSSAMQASSELVDWASSVVFLILPLILPYLV